MKVDKTIRVNRIEYIKRKLNSWMVWFDGDKKKAVESTIIGMGICQYNHCIGIDKQMTQVLNRWSNCL